MTSTLTLLEAIARLRPELPGLVGKDDWPAFETQLADYLRRLEQEPACEPILLALILDLFGRYPPAHARLVAVMAEMEEPVVQVRRAPQVRRTVSPTVTRYTDIFCPRRVWLKTPRFAVTVRLTVQPVALSAAVTPLTLQQDLPVQIRMDAPHFEPLNAAEQELLLPAGGDSPAVVFELRPRRPGPAGITFDFFQAGNPLGTATVTLEVTESEVSEAAESRPAQGFRLSPGASPPDLMLYVSVEHFQAQPALTFTLHRAGEVGRTFYPVPLPGDLPACAGRLYEQLTDLADAIDPTTNTLLRQRRLLPAEDIDRRLKQLGLNLWNDLIPADLKAVYQQERQSWRDKTLLIVSDEPYIPWEMVWPYGLDWEDEGPWCLSFRFSRWLRRDFQGNGHEAPPTQLNLKALACLAPTDAGLPAAKKERTFLEQLGAEYGVTDLSPKTPTWSAVLDLLERGDYDWLHVAAHGNFYAPSPDADAAIWLQDQRALTPDAIVGPAIERHLRDRRPGFFFNACHSGRLGRELVRLGGWANRLVSKGAGLFLAPLWTVEDQSALTFAQTVYQQLLAGASAAEAVRQARLATLQPGDPTWLAYTLYAHPNAGVDAADKERRSG